MNKRPDILQRIIDVKREEVRALRARHDDAEWRRLAEAAPPPRGFLRALQERHRRDGHPALIAEVKKASPSKGVIRQDFDPVWIAQRYESGGAACLSVLTDEQFFQGRLQFLEEVRRSVALPVLRKDFIIDEVQLMEARAAGADCVLLIAACLGADELASLDAAARALGMDVLVEVHDAAEWEMVAASGAQADLVGVNNRNLRTFEVSLETTELLASAILRQASLLVAESGIFTPEDVAKLSACGAGAVLVGESLMRHPDPGAAAKALLARA